LDLKTARWDWDQLHESTKTIYYLALSKTVKLIHFMTVSDKNKFLRQKNKFNS